MIQLFRPVMNTEEILTKLRGVFESGWLGTGSLVEQFEAAIAPWTKQKHFVATSSGTSALQLAVRALSLPKGSRFLTTPITFVSTNAALLWEGMVPVFGDVDYTGLSMLYDSFDDLKIDAVMVVHLGGQVQTVVTNRPVIEDCAHALGSNLPSTDNLRCWSFNEKKALPIGLGGGISTNNKYLAERIRKFRWLGISKSTYQRSEGGYDPFYDIPELGIKADMNDVQAAIGLAQLSAVEDQVFRRQDIARKYCGAFGHQFDSSSAYHFAPFLFKNRDKIAGACTKAGIQTGLHYQRCDLFPPFRDCPKIGRLDGAEYYVQHELTLPLHAALTDAEVEKVIEVVSGNL